MTAKCEPLPDDPREIALAAEFIALLKESVAVESSQAMNDVLRSKVESEAAIASRAFGRAVNRANRAS